MAIWKVSPERISLYQHPNADKLLVARVGLFPLVVGKSNNFEDGQIVIFAPKRSLLPEWLRSHYNNEETGESYLKNGTTVRSVTLRGQLSEGCTISPDIVNEKLIENEETKEFPQFIGKTLEDLIGEDISPLLGITEYIPPIPDEFAGELEQITGINVNQHDVESFTIFKDEFSEDEEVVVTEKLHGCKIYDTLVNTDHGKLKIGDIVENKMNVLVESFNHETGKKEFKPINNYFNHGPSDDWYELELEDGKTITITGNDRVYLPELGIYRHVRDLEVGDNFQIY